MSATSATLKSLVGLIVACRDHEPHDIRPSGEDHRSSYFLGLNGFERSSPPAGH